MENEKNLDLTVHLVNIRNEIIKFAKQNSFSDDLLLKYMEMLHAFVGYEWFRNQ